MIKIINKYKDTEYVDNRYYIGRGSPLGNPYSHTPSQLAQVFVATRDIACDKFQELFDASEPKGFTPLAMKVLSQMLRDLEQGKSIGLVCTCAPKRCHGETIKTWLENKLNEKKD